MANLTIAASRSINNLCNTLVRAWSGQSFPSMIIKWFWSLLPEHWMKFLYDYLPFIWARKNVEMLGSIRIIKMNWDIFCKYYLLFQVFISPLPLVLKDQLSMQLLCDLRSELPVGLFCWNIWKHILKSTVAFLNLSNCQGQADICENWNWHFLSKFIDDIKTKTVLLLFLYNILPYIMASSFQHLKALSLWRWWWTLNKFGSLQTSHRCCEKRQRRRAETFALLSFLILLCQDIYTIFRGNNQMSNISMKLSLKHGMINERSKHGNEAQIIYCGIFCEKSYFIITLIQQNIHSFMVIWPRSEN